ncbi:uncharacterized protein FIBRA_07451 [Fibroporia radiculosa]|uniref:Uncharacterized protein n=1 Tax=Fibroporia radiculosa TaxID=599839 RepID=J4IBT9_9APHY|nr:uncharacterized protein FIBRA_07451 [Fibroporia radiculosa]CCM05241.1 predicted protein [Fibroporia radiculosa]
MTVLTPDPAENWDNDFDLPAGNRQADSSTPLTKDRKNTLKRWTEPGPSTPSKRSAEQPENWDDDFRDNTDSPVCTRPSRLHSSMDEPENWDDDFVEAKDGHSPKRRTPRRHASWGSSDEEDDYGFGDREEDRTVTSRSRGIPLNIPLDVPPPVPPLPSPFPGSPNPSVFSMPVSSNGAHDSVAALSYSSTAHLALRPTLSSGSSALALLPPSPPIHRERRRLRKKSRPPPVMGPDIHELEDRATVPLQTQSDPSTPERKSGRSLDDPPSDAAPTASAPGSGPSSGKTPLLSRIGSVGKKWGAARKKRASTGPNEISLYEQEETREQASRPQSVLGSAASPPAPKSGWFFRGGGSGPGPPSMDRSALRHESSVDKLLAMAGLERNPDSPSRRGKARSPDGDQAESVESNPPLPRGLAEFAAGNNSVPSTAALLFGVPRRPTSIQMQATNSNSSSGSSWTSTRPPVPRHASYGHDLGRRRETSSSRSSSKQRSASASVEDVGKAGRAVRTREEKREAVCQPRNQSPSEHVKGKEKEGSRSFMGGMRRISLGGTTKHKRTKSSVPTSEGKRSTPATALSILEGQQDQTTPRPPSRVVRSSQDGLLPPIELQPPSPPCVSPDGLTLQGPGSEFDSLFCPQPALESSRSYPVLSTRSSVNVVRKSTSSPISPSPTPLPSPTRPKLSTSPQQAASLGRATLISKDLQAEASPVPRRNSLGDLKIPARISQAQVGLRRDLGMVREFAASVDQLKQLQQAHHSLVSEIHSVMSENLSQSPTSQPRALTPTFFNLPRPASRSRSNTNPTPSQALQTPHDLVLAFHTIEARYQLSWECAELLIDLGSGAPSTAPASAPISSPSSDTPASTNIPVDSRKSRERAITLAGDEPKPIIGPLPSTVSPTNTAQWRASTGRHDLSSRQLILLREMLNPDPSATMTLDRHLPIPEEERSLSPVNRSWRWGDVSGSTVTLPSEDGTQASGSGTSIGNAKKQKRRSSRLGMRGLRDMLKSLKKTYSEGPPMLPPLSAIAASTVSVSASTDSSLNHDVSEFKSKSLVQRRRAKTSTGPESMKSTRELDRHPNSPYGTSMSLTHRSSPRRPSLASIFRLGQKSKPASSSNEQSSDDLKASETISSVSGSHQTAASRSRLPEEEDWDRVESVADLEQAARVLDLPFDGTATVRLKKGKSPYLAQRDIPPETPHRSPSASQSSIWSADRSPQKTSSTTQSVLLSPTSRLRQLTERKANRQARPSSRGKDRPTAPSPSPKRPSSRNHRGGLSGSVRSAPSRPLESPDSQLGGNTEMGLKLAMTPENIKPLMENAREVHARCSECVLELRALLAATSPST